MTVLPRAYDQQQKEPPKCHELSCQNIGLVQFTGFKGNQTDNKIMNKQIYKKSIIFDERYPSPTII